MQIGVPAPGYRYYSDENITLDILPYGEIKVLETNIWYSCNFRNQNDQMDNYYDYLMFYNEYNVSNFHNCLSPTEMNFYWDGTDQVANDIVFDCLGDILDTRSLTTVAITGNNTTTHPNYIYYHNMINTYSIWRATLNEPEIFD